LHLLAIPPNVGEPGELLKRWRLGFQPHSQDVRFNHGRAPLLGELIFDPQLAIAIDQMVPLLFAADALIHQQGSYGDWRQLAQERGQSQLADPAGAKHRHGEGARWPSVVSTGFGPY
jgi:hypothetical protein